MDYDENKSDTRKSCHNCPVHHTLSNEVEKYQLYLSTPLNGAHHTFANRRPHVICICNEIDIKLLDSVDKISSKFSPVSYFSHTFICP